MTSTLDLNLLHSLDSLLQEVSVTRAAARAQVTIPAMSRALGRLRDAIRDPLLVRAGRGLTLTPFALSLRGEVHDAFRQASALLRPSASASLRTIERKLVIRCTDVLAAMLIAPLQAALAQDAPRLRLQFIPQGEEDAEALRNGEVDLDVGVIHMLEPEIRVRRLFHDRVVAVVRRDHPLAGRRLTPRRLVAFPHLSVSRRGRAEGPLDRELVKLGLTRRVAVVVPEFLPAIVAVSSSELVTTVPGLIARHLASVFPIAVLPLPVTVPELVVAQAWHPRLEADPTHRWLRERVHQAITEVVGSAGTPT